MNDNNDKCRENRDAVDISIWENEGGALDRYDMNHHYGRRIETGAALLMVTHSNRLANRLNARVHLHAGRLA